MSAAKLRAEVAAATAKMYAASEKLFRWAALAQHDPSPLVSADDIRAVAKELAHQGGRLDMAAEMTTKPRKK